MTDAELKTLTLASAAALIRRKQLSPVELTEAVLERIGRLNERMRAFITVTADVALAEATRAERQQDPWSMGPLHGVPVTLKDLFDTRGIPTTAGSKVFAQRIPAEDATVVKRLTRAGAVLVGKTNLHEFAFGATTVNPHYGPARNPWNDGRIAGGSSGGSAVAVALALGFGSLGSDTGGSIRIPAALCGIVGLKPTYGRTSLHGVIPLSPSLDHAGPMGRTVEDVALLLDAISGYDRRDPHSSRAPVPTYVDALTGDVRGIRIGVPRSYFFDQLEPEVEAAVRSALRGLETLGARLVDVDLPSAPAQDTLFRDIAYPEAYAYHERLLATHGELYGTDVRERLESGRVISFADQMRAQRGRARLDDELRAVFESADVMVTPTVPIVAPPIGQSAVRWGDGDVEPVGAALTRFTRPFNLSGRPTISIPCGFTADGMPIGMQIAGRAFDESTLLRVAHVHERTSPWVAARSSI